MKQKKIPMRMCLGCGTLKPKRDLIRIVKNKENEISIDLTGKAHGRGAYICPDKVCIKRAAKGKGFERSFGMAIGSEIFDKLEKQMEKEMEGK